MRSAVIFFGVLVGWLNLYGQSADSTNIVANVSAYTGRVVQVSGVVQAVEKGDMNESLGRHATRSR